MIVKLKKSLKKRESLLIKKNSKNPIVYNVPIGKHILDIPESTAEKIKAFVNKNKCLPTLIVTRIWIEKKEKKYRVHIGDLDDSY